MKRMFVALVAGGVFAVLCWDAGVRLADIYPTIGDCFKSPRRHAGKRIWIAANPVISSDATSFEVISYGTPVRVHSTMQPALGSTVMVYGTFQSDLSVLAIQSREESEYGIKRAGVYVVSFIVLAVGAFFFRRTFAWRDGAFHPR